MMLASTRAIIQRPYVIGGGLLLSAGGASLLVPVRQHYLPGETSSHTNSVVLASSSMALTSPTFTSVSSTIVPTLEAAARATRLVSTAVLMAMDYKLASLQQSLPTTMFMSETERQQRKERQFWENEKMTRQEKLEETQQFYARASHQELDYADRVQAKHLEKEAMLEAAEQVAEAEEQLVSLNNQEGNHQDRRSIHEKAARRLLNLCRQNKGVYIKIGQHLANLDYLLPHEYITTLSSLFDDTPQTDYLDVATVIEEDLGAPVSELFESFDPIPLASASLAQVHVAYDKTTGRKLAVKVQHRGLRETSRGDILTLVTVVRAAEQIFSDFCYGWLADEIAPHLPRELDFCNEAQNSERAAQYLALHPDLDCIVPKVLWDRTTERVLTMEFEEGFNATDVESIDKAGLQRKHVAHLVSSVFSSQVFGGPKGWVHCDPHPGNVLIRPSAKNPSKPQLVLLDHGLYRALDDDFRIHYAQLWKSLMLADLGGIKEACSLLGVGDAYPLFAAVITARPFDEMIERSKQKSLCNNAESFSKSKTDQVIMRGYAQRYLGQIFEMLDKLPRQMLLLLKMNDCLRHIDFSLGSPTNTMVVCGKYAATAVYNDEIVQSKGWMDKLRLWWSYAQVMLRIKVHDVGVWWLEKSNKVSVLSWR